jgi:integrase/recombinase XerD
MEPRREGLAMKRYLLPIYVQRFFTERLATQLHASPNTVASYRDTFRLLLKYASDRLGRPPTELQLSDIDADLVGDFLTFIETQRGNGARSRNTRLSAIRSFFTYVAAKNRNFCIIANNCWRCLPSDSRGEPSTS